MSVFLGGLLGMMVLEAIFPRKMRTQPRGGRWFTNVALTISYSILARVIFPLAVIGFATYVGSKNWGLFNVLGLPVGVNIILSILVLDCCVYWQHVISHKFPLFWALHKVHHSDRDIDVTTGIRFHPGEIVLSLLYKMGLVLVLGPCAMGVFAFEILLNGSAMFNHANVKLPVWLDKGIRVLFVTPDMHRVHHSVLRNETDSNYGFFLSVWDRVFKSYIAQPDKGHENMTIGLPEYQNDRPAHFIWCLFLPFRR